MLKEEIREALTQLRAANPGADTILISDEIDRALYARLSKKLADREKKKRSCLVFLNTHGGDAHAGFRIARCLRFHYAKVRLVVPHHCKSAGTLIAIGADEVAIGNLGELGPLDVQISKRDEMLERSSGLDFTEALQAMLAHAQAAFRANILDLRAGAGISTKMAGEFASQLAIGVVAPMYAQIDPIQVGEVHRAMKIAFEYGTRLNEDSKQLKPEALIELVSGYPDHSFVIDRKEAKRLFKSVTPLTSEEESFSNKVWDVFFKGETGQCLLLAGDTTQEDQSEEGRNDEVQPDDALKPEGARHPTDGSTAAGDGSPAAETSGSKQRADAVADGGAGEERPDQDE